MNAMDLMTPAPTVITADATIPRTAEVMRTLDVGMLPVVDDLTSRKLIGVITDRDIVVRCLADQGLIECQVRNHMSASPLIYVRETTSLAEITEKMERFQVRRLPVVDARMRVVGIVTQADLARRVGPQNPALVEEVLKKISTPGALVH
jgi:CBS domain-containing protein